MQGIPKDGKICGSLFKLFGNILEVGCTDKIIHQATQSIHTGFPWLFNSVFDICILLCAFSLTLGGWGGCLCYVCFAWACVSLFAMEMEGCCSAFCTTGSINVKLTTYFRLLASKFTYGQFVITKYFWGKNTFALY
jgi:hypothetical protein